VRYYSNPYSRIRAGGLAVAVAIAIEDSYSLREDSSSLPSVNPVNLVDV
jgi:hypothetical protein